MSRFIPFVFYTIQTYRVFLLEMAHDLFVLCLRIQASSMSSEL